MVNKSATGSSVCGTDSAASNCRNPSSATSAISPRIPPKWVYTAIVDVPAAPATLRVCSASGPCSSSRPNRCMQHLVANTAFRR